MNKTKPQTKQKQPTLTPKQKIILFHLYRFRFLNTHHIQHILLHQQPSRIQAWMKDLTEKGYVIQFYERESFIENIKPAVYCLTTKARVILKENKACDQSILKRLYRERKLSKKFQAHCLLLADHYLQMRSDYENTNATLHYFTQVELVGYNHFPQPLPDGYFAIKSKGKKTKRYFIELFDEGTPRFALRHKIRRYVTCAEDSEWENQTQQPFPVILFICPNTQMRKYVERFTQNLLYESEVDLLFEVKIKDLV